MCEGECEGRYIREGLSEADGVKSKKGSGGRV